MQKPSNLRQKNFIHRVLSGAGTPKLLEWFLLFLARIASSDSEDRRLAKDGGEGRFRCRVDHVPTTF